jgi:hypothetical protein
MNTVDPEHLMVDDRHGQLLFSLKNKLTLWNYQFDANAHSADFFGRTRDIVDGHLVYAATYDLGRGNSGLAVGAVQLPGPKVKEAEASVNVESLYVVKAGTGIRLQIDCGEDTPRVQKAITAAVAAAGWKIDPNSPHALVAEMKLGQQQETKYRQFGTGDVQSATFTPHISNLKLMVGEQAAWQTGTSTGAPPLVSLRSGESVQSEVDKYQKPHPEFFDSVVLPKRILDPKYSRGLGTTMVTNRGLIPKAERSGSATEPK